MVGFLLDLIVVVQTRNKQDLSVGECTKLWKYHVISLHLHLPNPYIDRFMPNASVGHLGSDIANINPLINTNRYSL